MTKQEGFTQRSEDGAVRLALTSGRTWRELAETRSAGLSTLTRRICRRRDRESARDIDGFDNLVWHHSALEQLSPPVQKTG